jgi:hypothetical protein
MTAAENNTLDRESCGNCGAMLSDRFCARCGQDSHTTLTVGHFLEECVEGLTHFDSTFWRTFMPLLFRPGLITERYLSGKRKFYAPPVRTYLVLSLLYFLLSSLATTMHVDAIKANGEGFRSQDCAEFAQGMEWLSGFVPDIEGACLRAQRDEGRALNTTLRGMLPKVMFVVLPLVALVQYWIYRRQRPLYVENLIFVLHFQSFFYLAASLLIVIAASAAAIFHATGVTTSLEFALYVWAAIYLFIANRRVYRAGKFKAVMSIVALALAYMVFSVLGFSIAAIYALSHA